MPAPKWSPQSNADILAKFLQQGGGSALGQDEGVMDANMPLAAAGLRSSRNAENRERMVNDPGNPRFHMVDRFIREDEALDPYSDTNSGLRQVKEQDATDVMDRFFQQQPMRDQQNVDAGNRAEEVSYGTKHGDFGAQVSPTGVQALDAAGDRTVAITNAQERARMALRASMGLGGNKGAPGLGGSGVVLPPGFSMDDYDGPDDPNDLTKSEKAQALFKSSDADPAAQAAVRAILGYRMAGITGAALARSPTMQKYMGLAQMIDPDFKGGEYETAYALRQQLLKGGSDSTTGGKLRAMNAGSGHLLGFDHAIKELDNSNWGGKGLNAVENFFLGLTPGSGRVMAPRKLQGMLDTEIAKFLAGSGGASNELRNQMSAGLDTNSPRNDQEAYRDTTADMIVPQHNALRQPYTRFPSLLKEFDSMVEEPTRRVMEKKWDTPPPTSTGPAAAAPAPARPAPTTPGVPQQASGPAVGTEGVVNGIPAIWNGRNWVRKR